MGYGDLKLNLYECWRKNVIVSVEHIGDRFPKLQNPIKTSEITRDLEHGLNLAYNPEQFPLIMNTGGHPQDFVKGETTCAQ